MRAWMFLPLLGGCFGVYGEVAATTYPSSSLGSASSSASSISFNVGVDFGNLKKRFAMGYEQQSISVDNGSATVGSASMRLDFNVLSLSDRAKLRLGGGFGFGSATTKLAGMSRTDASGGGAFAGLAFSYFPTWHIGLHALAGPAFGTASMPQVAGANADFSGTGATFRLAVTYQFSDVRPDTTKVFPLENNTDITGLLEQGAKQLGCTTYRRSTDTSAYLDVTCSYQRVTYFQIAEGMMVECEHMSEGQCDAISSRVLDAAKKQIPQAAPEPMPAAVPAAATTGSGAGSQEAP